MIRILSTIYDIVKVVLKPDDYYEKEQGIFMINKMDDVGIRILILVSLDEQS